MKLYTSSLLAAVVVVVATAPATATATRTLERDSMKNKTALCLGCTRGIGEAAARQLASLGANVVVTGRSVDDGTQIAKDVGGTFVRCDMGERKHLEDAFDVTMEKYGRIDAVFCNGGIEGQWDPLDEIEPEAIESIGRINGLATLHVFDLAVRAFLQNQEPEAGGSLVFTSSIAAFVNEALSSNFPSTGSGVAYYVGTKAIAPAMTRASAMLYAAHNIRVNAITPGVYDTKMAHDLVSKYKFASTIGAQTTADWAAFNPAFPGCAADPNDAAAAAVALLSNNSYWPPASVIVTDGPYTFESNVLSDKLGRNALWGPIDASLLRDSTGAPVNITNEDIQQLVESCSNSAAASNENKDEL